MKKKAKRPGEYDEGKMKGGDDDEEEEEGEGEEGEKSLTGDDLDATLDMLEKAAQTETGRRVELLAKAGQGTLSKSENKELIQILETGNGALSGEIRKSFDDNAPLQDAIDVSDYLSANHEEMLKSQDRLSNAIESGNGQQIEFNMVLAKAVADVGRLVQGMSQRLGVIEDTPARGPKSKGLQPLQKSFGGSAPGETLLKSQVLDTLEVMHVDSMEKGNDGKGPTGEDLGMAIIKYESTNFISPKLMEEVIRHRAN